MRWLRKLVTVVFLAGAPAIAHADAIRVEPGLWEFVSSLPDPFGGEPMKQVHRTCVRDRNITPERVMAQLKECRISNAVIKGAQARWKMSCETPAGPMAGSGALRSTPTAVSGSLDLAMTIGSLEIPVTGAFRGKRLGNCR